MKPKATRNKTPQDRIVVIGAGISGILIGIKLLEQGITDFVILEKADSLGGTWRENTYPGVACDVAAHLYVYSFAPNPKWRTRYASGGDLWKYYHDVAERYGVLSHISYGKEVTDLTLADDSLWRITTSDGTVLDAAIVISAVGRLHHPVLPDIRGMSDFAGPSFHTARWDHSVNLNGKRLGIIGTGSTATQVVTATASLVQQLKLFQRTAQWVYPVSNTPVPWWKRLLFRLSPERAKAYYRQLRDETNRRGKAATGDAAERAERDEVCRQALARVKDPVLRAKLTPDYEPGCKRLVMSESFYDVAQRPNVDVVTDRIDHIEAAGVVTEDGVLHELDALVYATGFDAHAFLRPIKVTGENGISLDEVWQDLPLTYRTVSIPHMPNLFVINGPYSPGGNASVVGIVEVQVDYVLQLVDRVIQNQSLLCAREDAAEAWLDEVRQKARQTVWGSGNCQSWYLDKTGTPNIDPTPLSDLKKQLAKPALADFVERPRIHQPTVSEFAA